MGSQLRTWITALPFTDPLRRAQAATLQSLIFMLIAASLIGAPLSLSATSQVDQVVGIVASLVQALLLLVAPLIGLFDSARAAALSEKILAAIANQRAKTVIFDITGVAVADQHTIAELLELAGAVRLLGAEPVIVGVRPEVAIALATQEIDLTAQRFYPNLQEAVQVLRIQRMG